MGKKLLRLFFFAIIVGILMLAITFANWLPLFFRSDTLRSYHTVEEAQRALGVRNIAVPAYFPQSISWPPSTVLAQTNPYPAFLMGFREEGRDGISLLIVQTADAEFMRHLPLQVAGIEQQHVFDLKARNAQLTVGRCGDHAPCSSVTWFEGKYATTVTMKAPPFEVIRIAHSMIH